MCLKPLLIFLSFIQQISVWWLAINIKHCKHDKHIHLIQWHVLKSRIIKLLDQYRLIIAKLFLFYTPYCNILLNKFSALRLQSVPITFRWKFRKFYRITAVSIIKRECNISKFKLIFKSWENIVKKVLHLSIFQKLC